MPFISRLDYLTLAKMTNNQKLRKVYAKAYARLVRKQQKANALERCTG